MAMSGGDGSDGGINRNWVVAVVVGSDGRVCKTKVVEPLVTPCNPR